MKYLFFIVAFCFSTLAYAEDITIEMLNKLEKRSMVFSQELVKVDVGDTVFWKATDPGHNVEFISKNGVPEGVEKFNQKLVKMQNILSQYQVFMHIGAPRTKRWV